MKDEEYIADFCLVSRRTLSPGEHRVFRYHYLLGADWKLCCMKLDKDRGSFFHDIYRIEQKLGKVFRELKPHALYPVEEYYNGRQRCEKPPLAVITPYVIEEDAEQDAKAKAKLKSLLKFPIKKVA